MIHISVDADNERAIAGRTVTTVETDRGSVRH